MLLTLGLSTGYICGAHDCQAPAGVTYSQSCPSNYYLCPAEYNYGCCKTGMGCALNACYATTPSTYVLTETFTTTADGQASTATTTSLTVITPTKPSSLPSDDPNALAKFIPVTLAKTAATSPPSADGPGLTQAQVGGIVGGALALLVVVLAATFIIVRKLHLTAKLVSTSASGATRSQGAKPQAPRHKPTPSQVDRMEYDDLLQGDGRVRALSELSSSNTTPFASADTRNASMDGARGYFDGQARPGRPRRPRPLLREHRAADEC